MQNDFFPLGLQKYPEFVNFWFSCSLIYFKYERCRTPKLGGWPLPCSVRKKTVNFPPYFFVPMSFLFRGKFNTQWVALQLTHPNVTCLRGIWCSIYPVFLFFFKNKACLSSFPRKKDIAFCQGHIILNIQRFSLFSAT